MSIQSLGGLYGPTVMPPRPSRPDESQEGQRQPRVDTPVPQDTSRVAGEARNLDAASHLPVEPPAGTDPQLWSVLTTEERRFFAQARAMGPVTYGRSNLGLAELGLQRGGRLDVKV